MNPPAEYLDHKAPKGHEQSSYDEGAGCLYADAKGGSHMSSLKSCLAGLALALTGCASDAPELQQEKPAACAAAGTMTDLLAMQAAVKEHMAYPLGGGVPVDDVVDRLRARAAAVTDDTEHLRVLESFVYSLGDHHAHLSTNDKLSPRLVPTGATVWVEWRAQELVVTEVREAAALAGLKAGVMIKKIDGVPVAQVLSPPLSVPDRLDAMMGFAGRVKLAGTREHAVVVSAAAPDGPVRDITIPAGVPAGGEALAAISYPREGVAVIRLNNSIGNTDLNPVFDGLMKKARQARTIILDLRDTPSGGDSVVAKPLMAWFVDGTKGYQKHERDGRSWVEQVQGRKDHFKGKLVVLIDHWTGSMGEGTAIGLRAAAGATLVGTPMAGLRGAIESFDVPCFGVSLRIPVERLYEVGGAPRELAQPDVLVSEEDLAQGTGDVILQRALSLAL